MPPRCADVGSETRSRGSAQPPAAERGSVQWDLCVATHKTYLRVDPSRNSRFWRRGCRPASSRARSATQPTVCSPSWRTHEACSYVKRPGPETGGTGGRDAHTHHNELLTIRSPKKKEATVVKCGAYAAGKHWALGNRSPATASLIGRQGCNRPMCDVDVRGRTRPRLE